MDCIHNLDNFYSIRPRTLLKRGFDRKAHPSPTVTVKHIIVVEKKPYKKKWNWLGYNTSILILHGIKCTQVIFMLRCNEFCSRLEWGSTKSILHFGMPFHQQNIFMKSHGFGFIIFDFGLPIAGKLGGLINGKADNRVNPWRLESWSCHMTFLLKNCRLGSRIRDMEAESYNWSHFLVNLW